MSWFLCCLREICMWVSNWLDRCWVRLFSLLCWFLVWGCFVCIVGVSLLFSVMIFLIVCIDIFLVMICCVSCSMVVLLLRLRRVCVWLVDSTLVVMWRCMRGGSFSSCSVFEICGCECLICWVSSSCVYLKFLSSWL